MNTRRLGNSDLNITPIGFGAWALGGGHWQFGWGAQEDQDSVAAVHRALELGVNWIDTAAVYGLGHSEEVVARALADWKGRRPYVFTKCGMVYSVRPRSSQTKYILGRDGRLFVTPCRKASAHPERCRCRNCLRAGRTPFFEPL